MLLVTSSVMAVGCNNTADDYSTPALLTETSKVTRAEIQQAIVSLKGGVEPILSVNVFTQQSVLILEHGKAKQFDQSPVLGAHDLPYESFELRIKDESCALFYPKLQRFKILKHAKCKAAKIDESSL
ncbi:hypothetical protein ACSLBF_01295 [Pseudoalteromonas sp. T1lg65]|uniref:hypothetical protein n=1 Tax=Pseudoalteromonas sp. T1lg65 TaxID=2077101 RepID=UPI003F7A455E